MVLPPTRGEVDEMDRLARILRGERPPPTVVSATTSAGAPNPDAIILQKGPTSKDVSDMAKIMGHFSEATGIKSFRTMADGATNTVKVLVEDSQTSPELREALITDKTDSGIRIGAWEISKHQRESVSIKSEFIYRVHNINTGQRIKAPFLILESARAVVKLLNNGVDLGHPTIRKVAQFEIEYRNARSRALEEKRSWQRAKKINSNFKMNLYEAKFDAAKTKALLVRERVINLYNQL